MSRAAFQTSPLISFSHFPRGTRSYITASLALRSRQQATNHTEVNKHIVCLRQDEYSTITPNTTVVLMMNECHGNGAFGFDFPNLPFNCDTVKLRRVLVPQTERLETPGFRAVHFIIFYFFLATQRAITTPISSGTGVRSGSSCQCTALHSSHTVFLFTYLFLLERPVGPLTRFLLILHH